MQWTPLRKTLCTLATLLITSCTTATRPPRTNHQTTLNHQTTPNTAEQGSSEESTVVVSQDSPPVDHPERHDVAIVVRNHPPLNPPDIESILCKDHKNCRTKRTWNAGLDDQKQPMQVVETSIDTKITDLLNKDPYYFHEIDKTDSCEPLQYWFVRPTLMQNNTPDAQPVLLLNACGGSINFNGIFNDDVEVGPHSFRYWKLYADRSEDSFKSTTLELPSLQTVQSTSFSQETGLYPSLSYTSLDRLNLADQDYGFNTACEVEEDNNEPDNDKSYDTPNYNYQHIFIAPLPDAFRQDGWKTTTLGTCSTTVTSLGNQFHQNETTLDTGFVTHGKPVELTDYTADTHFKTIMATPTEIYVEVTDYNLIKEAKNILHTDHLELWLRTQITCPTPNKNLFQFGITPDGKVHNFYGKHPEPPTAETTTIKNQNGSHTTRFKITIPKNYDALTLVYSDTDNGRSPKRLIAISDLKFKDQFSIGQVAQPKPHTTRHLQLPRTLNPGQIMKSPDHQRTAMTYTTKTIIELPSLHILETSKK